MAIANKISEKLIGVYAIISPTNKIYVGSSIDIETRFKYYKKLRCKSQIKLYNSLSKHGPEAHTYAVIKLCNVDELYKYEREYGLFYDVLGENGLNCQLPGYGEQPKLESEESRKRKSARMTGSKRSEEARRNMSISAKKRGFNGHGFKKGHKLNDTKPQMSEESKMKMRAALKGRKHSEDHKKKIGIANKGKIKTEEAIEKWRKSREGFKHSEESKRLISEKQKGRSAKHLCKPITMYDMNSVLLGEYESITEAGQKTGVNRKAISENIRYSKNGLIRKTKSQLFGLVYFKYKTHA